MPRTRVTRGSTVVNLQHGVRSVVSPGGSNTIVLLGYQGPSFRCRFSPEKNRVVLDVRQLFRP